MRQVREVLRLKFVGGVRDDDTAVYGDKGYASGAKKCAAEAAGVLWAVKKAKPGH
jgi:IS5 family transposase